MISVKICGITNIGDARSAVECGADALGFIFYPGSLRYIRPERAREIIQSLPGGIMKVGVFVNQEIREVEAIASFCGLHLIQLHGDESLQYCRQFASSVLIKAASLSTEEDVLRLRNYPVRAILVDASGPGAYGGTGRLSDWKLARRVKEAHPLIIAGGLNAENIREAIETARPEGVDINSGVEISPGKKDHDKMRNIIGIVRETDERDKFRTKGRPHAKIFAR